MTSNDKKNWLESNGLLVDVSCTNGVYLIHWEPTFDKQHRYSDTGDTPEESIDAMYGQIKQELFNIVKTKL